MLNHVEQIQANVGARSTDDPSSEKNYLDLCPDPCPIHGLCQLWDGGY
jgi:hypothetical protein